MSGRINKFENKKIDKYFPTFKIIFSSFLKTCLLSLEAKDLEESWNFSMQKVGSNYSYFDAYHAKNLVKIDSWNGVLLVYKSLAIFSWS